MSAPTITCRSGHVNSVTQKFCGDCGLSLAGVCPNGHQNPDGHRYCGQCGSPLGQPTSGNPSPTTTPTTAKHQVVTANHSAETGPSRPADEEPPASGESGNAAPDYRVQSPGSPETRAVARTPRIGDELILPDGIDAVVVHCDNETVWLRTTKGLASFGTSKHRRSDVEASLAEKRIAFAEHSAAGTDPGAEPQSGGSIGPQHGGPGILPPAGSADGIETLWGKLPTWGKVSAIAVPGVLLLLMLIVPLSGSGPSGSSGGGRASPGTSTLDDWVASVCKVGTYSNRGGFLKNADASGICMSPTDMPIYIGQYSSSFSAQNDAAMLPGASYATLPQSDGRLCMFLAASYGSGDILRPLARFGADFGTS